MYELAVIEQAKGVLMLRYGIGSYEALGVLETWSRQSGESMAGLARTITHAICQGHAADADDGWLVRWLEQRFREELPETGHATVEAVRRVV